MEKTGKLEHSDNAGLPKGWGTIYSTGEGGDRTHCDLSVILIVLHPPAGYQGDSSQDDPLGVQQQEDGA